MLMRLALPSTMRLLQAAGSCRTDQRRFCPCSYRVLFISGSLTSCCRQRAYRDRQRQLVDDLRTRIIHLEGDKQRLEDRIETLQTALTDLQTRTIGLLPSQEEVGERWLPNTRQVLTPLQAENR